MLAADIVSQQQNGEALLRTALMQDSLRSARLHWIPRQRLQQVKLQVMKLEITAACLCLLGNALCLNPLKQQSSGKRHQQDYVSLHVCIRVCLSRDCLGSTSIFIAD